MTKEEKEKLIKQLMNTTTIMHSTLNSGGYADQKPEDIYVDCEVSDVKEKDKSEL